jgi:hypothetical protein
VATLPEKEEISTSSPPLLAMEPASVDDPARATFSAGAGGGGCAAAITSL